MNRLRQARERAGLTIGQARRLLVRRDVLMSDTGLETMELSLDDALDIEPFVSVLASMYGVSTCWLLGHEDQHVHEETKRMISASSISADDKTEILLFNVSLAYCASCIRSSKCTHEHCGCQDEVKEGRTR